MQSIMKMSTQEADVMGWSRNIKWPGLIFSLVLLAVCACAGADHQGGASQADDMTLVVIKITPQDPGID